jgi:RHS repeat-associated protein
MGVAEKGTISAICFGGCLQSQGTLGTDKLFTGQRLDNSGLYYYGARYYDPTIGRFVSPDTIIPTMANPQSLNRFTYCLNNPMKFVDPSGNIVKFSDRTEQLLTCATLGIAIPREAFGNELELVAAYCRLQTYAPDLTSLLEAAPETITITSGGMSFAGQDISNAMGMTTPTEDYSSSGNINIQVGPKAFEKGLEFVTVTLGHEGFHSAQYLGSFPWPGNSVANEAFAYSFGYAVGQKMSYDAGTVIPLSGAFREIKPGMTADMQEALSTAGQTLFDTSEMYRSYPSGMSGKPSIMKPWPTSGREYFLMVAQQIWIK